MEDTQSTFRERAGVYVSAFIVAAYVASGFVQPLLNSVLGVDVPFEAGWSSAMNALAGGALGFLVGKQSSNTSSSGSKVSSEKARDLSE